MRRPRYTFISAFHHVMNRGLNGSIIFPASDDKQFFLNVLHAKSKLLKIKIFAYSIMDNHYHIILQNTSGRLSDFMRQLNSIYATYFRKKYGGQGYVFQNRFKSTLIQNNNYLLTAIIYTLLNPVRANISKSIFDYKWSSIHEYFNKKNKDSITDAEFVKKLFQTWENFKIWIKSNIEIKEENTRLGKVIGDESFIKEAENKFNRRKEQEATRCRRRLDDNGFRDITEVEKEFEITNKVKLREINVYTIAGKRLRLKLLIKLREESGLKYSQINKLNLFKNLKYYSLSVLYNRAAIRYG